MNWTFLYINEVVLLQYQSPQLTWLTWLQCQGPAHWGPVPPLYPRHQSHSEQERGTHDTTHTCTTNIGVHYKCMGAIYLTYKCLKICTKLMKGETYMYMEADWEQYL